MTLTPTPEQAEIISSASSPSPLLIEAYAGTAKTTTIALAAPRIKVPALALAFNRKIAEDLKGRLPGNWAVKTLNGLGSGAWARALPPRISLELDNRKLGRLTSAVAKEAKAGLSREQWAITRSLVSAAMRAGLSPGDQGAPLLLDTEESWRDLAEEVEVPHFDIPLQIELAHIILSRSILEAKAGRISFDDQIYCPTILGGKWPRYPALAVDEAQDLSPLNHRQIALASREDAKIIAVGDSRQAIYAFRGADSASIQSLQALREGWERKRLTLTFRCPQVIVARQQRHAPGFRAATANRAGHFANLSYAAGAPLGGWSWPTLRGAGDGSIAVLCRNNAPILRLAFALLRQRVVPVVAGRDLTQGLLALLRKIAPDDTPAEILRGRIAEWAEGERSRLLGEGKEDLLDRVDDRAESLLAVLDGSEARDARGLREAMDLLFSRDSGDLTLSTIHRAKGLEWDIVLHLDPWRIPSRQARAAAREGREAQLEQEWNLKYVCETRTRNILLEANQEDFAGGRGGSSGGSLAKKAQAIGLF